MSLAINNPLFWVVNMFALSTGQWRVYILRAVSSYKKKRKQTRRKAALLYCSRLLKDLTAHCAGHVSPSTLVGWQPCALHTAMDVVLLIHGLNLNVVMDSMQAKWKAQVCSADEGSS